MQVQFIQCRFAKRRYETDQLSSTFFARLETSVSEGDTPYPK
ncbi:hypothetical protein [Oculatella sp. LEGE 06141]|nr:hypothetical protein [Oculatella sp. LEGE 06141]